MVVPRTAHLVLGSALLLSCLPSTITSPSRKETHVFRPPLVQPVKFEECPASCHEVFTKLECGVDCEGGAQQRVNVQERGEPKSGTGFMYEWAMGALGHACTYLVRAYGDGSCWIEWEFKNRTLVFEPAQAVRGTATCPCDGVSRVVVTLTNNEKHALPVSDDCGYSRRGGMAKTTDTVCISPNFEDPPKNQEELWSCGRKSDCAVVDDYHQMVVMRDPRPMAVSAYFHRLHHDPRFVEDSYLDEFVLAILPVLCQWLSMRFFVFKFVATKSTLFWYDDALGDPASWYSKLFALIGLNMPDNIVAKAADGALDGKKMFGFPMKGMDPHEGRRELNKIRSFRDELKNETTLSDMDDVLRKWLPPIVLEKFGVLPYIF